MSAEHDIGSSCGFGVRVGRLDGNDAEGVDERVGSFVEVCC
jgi:hypothetical protein